MQKNNLNEETVTCSSCDKEYKQSDIAQRQVDGENITLCKEFCLDDYVLCNHGVTCGNYVEEVGTSCSTCRDELE